MIRLVSLLVLICLTSFVQAGAPAQGATVHTLVIDPGHGGMDPGAIGPGGHHEADLALAVSLKFGEMVKEAFPDVKIIYTRTTDKFVSLADRADMANKAKADLFICIHLNSATNHDAYGTSTYVLGLHRTDDNLEIAKRENAVIDLETNKDKKYEFDPNSPEGHIIMSMKQNAFLDQSILIASKIEDELAVLSKRKSRGVKQAGFWVLYKTAMPSLLAEIGFISNPTEETYLSTDGGQANIATSIYKAFRGYKYEIEGKKDTPVLAANILAAEKKKEQQSTDPQSGLKLSPVTSPTKQQEPEVAKQPEVKQRPTSATDPSHQTAKKEEKAWEPDTLSPVESPVVYKDQVAATNFQPIDRISTPVTKDTIRVKPATSPETMTKKLVPVRTGNEPNTVKKEEPKTAVKVVKEETKAVAKVKEPVKPAVDSTKIKAQAAAKLRSDSLKADARMKHQAAMAKAADDAMKARTDSIDRALAKRDALKVKADSVKMIVAAKREAARAKAKEDSIKIVTARKEAIAARADSVKLAAAKREAWKAKVDSIKLAAAQKATAKKEPVAKVSPKKETPAPVANTAQGEDVMFTVQILAAHKPPKNYDDLVSSFGLINREDIGDGVVRYMAGQYTHFKEAEKTLAIAKSKGFPTAFIIGYVNDVRQDVKQTKELGQKHP